MSCLKVCMWPTRTHNSLLLVCLHLFNLYFDFCFMLWVCLLFLIFLSLFCLEYWLKTLRYGTFLIKKHKVIGIKQSISTECAAFPPFCTCVSSTSCPFFCIQRVNYINVHEGSLQQVIAIWNVCTALSPLTHAPGVLRMSAPSRSSRRLPALQSFSDCSHTKQALLCLLSKHTAEVQDQSTVEGRG